MTLPAAGERETPAIRRPAEVRRTTAQLRELARAGAVPDARDPDLSAVLIRDRVRRRRQTRLPTLRDLRRRAAVRRESPYRLVDSARDHCGIRALTCAVRLAA